MRINYNVSAMLTNNALANNDSLLAKSLERLSSGLKINHAKDNPAGLAMAKRMDAQLAGLAMANQNASDGVSVIEIADGAMTEISEMLQRINELAIKAANGPLSDKDRATIQEEVEELQEEITRVSETTEFNGMKLLNGDFDMKGFTNNLDIKVNGYAPKIPEKVYTIKSLTITAPMPEPDPAAGETEEITSNDAAIIDKGYQIDVNNIELGPEFPAGVRASVRDNIVTFKNDTGFELRLDISGLDLQPGDTVTFPATGAKMEIASGNSNIGDITVNVLNPDYDDCSIGSITVNVDNTAGTKEVKMTLGPDFPEGASYSLNGDIVSIVDAEGQPIMDLDISGVTASATYAGTGAADGLAVDVTGIGAMRLQIGANEGQILAMDIPGITLKNMGIEELDVSTKRGALDAIARVDHAISYLSSVRGKLGAYQNRLESSINNLDVIYENLTGAYSRIMDVDMAEEMTNYTTYQVLTQAGTSMLAQANERPSQVLQLLQ